MNSIHAEKSLFTKIDEKYMNSNIYDRLTYEMFM